MSDNNWSLPLLLIPAAVISTTLSGCRETGDATANQPRYLKLPAPYAFEVAEPRSLPSGAAVPRLRLIALDSSRTLYREWSGDVRLRGLRTRADTADAEESWVDTPLRTSCREGELVLTSDDFAGKDFSIAEGGIQVSIESSDGPLIVSSPNTTHLFGWLRLLPPVAAIVLAILIRDVNVALIIATFSGCLLYFGIDVVGAFDMLCDVLMRQLADPDHASVILFTVFLGSMIGLMNDSGGTKGVVDQLARYAGTRRRGQFLTWVMGLIVFFDDYANTLLIGGAMRPLSDRLRISREKLAFLIDSTAAPIAGIAIVSTWLAFEIDQIRAGLEAASVVVPDGYEAAATRIFYETIPYRFYPIIALGMVAVIALSGRDFGPMRRAESHASRADRREEAAADVRAGSIWFAILPIVALVVIVITCFMTDVDSYRALLIGSLAASMLAFLLPAAAKTMTFEECSRSWTNGVGSMIPAIIVLTLAWSVSDICRPDKLDTAGLIISWVGDSVSVEFLPAIAFIVAGAVAFSIGSSFTTMALLTPLIIPLCWSLLDTTAGAEISDPVFLGAVGAILAGAIFGDHCSPISDTTVLSSAAAGCNHLDHVTTQMPYAITAAACSLVFCYIPIGYGLAWWIALPAGMAATALIVIFAGRPPEISSRNDNSAADL